MAYTTLYKIESQNKWFFVQNGTKLLLSSNPMWVYALVLVIENKVIIMTCFFLVFVCEIWDSVWL